MSDDFAAGKRESDQVQGTKYEVKELGATELRRGVGRRQSRNDARGMNQSTREVEAPLVRRASVTRMRINITAFLENFIGAGVGHAGNTGYELCEAEGRVAVLCGCPALRIPFEIFIWWL